MIPPGPSRAGRPRRCSTRSAARRAQIAGLACGGLLLGAISCATPAPVERAAAPTTTASVTTGPSSTYPGWAPTTPSPRLTPSESFAAGLQPRSVRIDAIGVTSDLLPLAVDAAGVLVPPDRYDVAGWFTGGPVPGQVGPAIIAGHVNSRAGPGIFYRLEEMTVGDRIEVTRSDGSTVNFEVDRVEQYPKTDFPTERVYGPTPARELRLITCGGEFDSSRRSYLDNIVVYAVLDQPIT